MEAGLTASAQPCYPVVVPSLSFSYESNRFVQVIALEFQQQVQPQVSLKFDSQHPAKRSFSWVVDEFLRVCLMVAFLSQFSRKAGAVAWLSVSVEVLFGGSEVLRLSQRAVTGGDAARIMLGLHGFRHSVNVR